MAEGDKTLDGVLKGKGCVTQIIILILILVFGWYAWSYFSKGGEVEDLTPSNLFPLEYSGEIDANDWSTFTSTTGTNLTFRYNPSWELKQETSDGNEFSSFVSPTDPNGYYFCFDLKEYSPSFTIDLGTKANVLFAESFSSEGIGKPLTRITYMAPRIGDFNLSLIDDTSVEKGDDVGFEQSITNPRGYRLNIMGVFNCNDEDSPDMSFDNFENSQAIQEALYSLRTIHY